MTHVVVQMMHDPDRTEKDDEDDGNGGNKDA